MSEIGFQKKKNLDRKVGGWVELYPNFFWMFGIFLYLQGPLGGGELLIIGPKHLLLTRV